MASVAGAIASITHENIRNYFRLSSELKINSEIIEHVLKIDGFMLLEMHPQIRGNKKYIDIAEATSPGARSFGLLY